MIDEDDADFVEVCMLLASDDVECDTTTTTTTMKRKRGRPPKQQTSTQCDEDNDAFVTYKCQGISIHTGNKLCKRPAFYSELHDIHPTHCFGHKTPSMVKHCESCCVSDDCGSKPMYARASTWDTSGANPPAIVCKFHHQMFDEALICVATSCTFVDPFTNIRCKKYANRGFVGKRLQWCADHKPNICKQLIESKWDKEQQKMKRIKNSSSYCC